MSNFHTYKTKVYYEDTDAGGIVYYAKYLHFIERARTEMIYDRLGLNHKQLKIDFNTIFVVRECNVKYHKSANFEDHLDVLTYVSKSFVTSQALVPLPPLWFLTCCKTRGPEQ